MEGPWISRRSQVYARHGMVASTQPAACEVGNQILRNGGNACDAAVAMAAVLNVTEPCSTGIGGDGFLLWFDGEKKTVTGMNGSGRCPSNLTIEKVRAAGVKDDYVPMDSVHAVTVPGAAALWVDAVEKYGSMKINDILQPAIDLAEEGAPIHQCAAQGWALRANQLNSSPNGGEMLIDGSPPKKGDIFKNPNLAETFRLLAKHGKDGFYKGRVAEAIVQVLSELGGTMTLEDLATHTTTEDDPIHVNYHGVDVYEIPPNGQGITALIALQILNKMDVQRMEHNGVEYLHTLIEAVRLAFADARWYVADPRVTDVPITELISEGYADVRRKLIDPTKASVDVEKGSPVTGSDTVYFSVVDGQGNACSFINSNYHGFGSGIIPKGCGFTLQNRGANFSLDPKHPNALAPNKRSYHTIIPGMSVKDGNLHSSFGVMGGFMQPQGHVQVMLNMIDFGMDAQEALDAPRFCIQPADNGPTCIEAGVKQEVLEKLIAMGHQLHPTPLEGNDRALMGRGQIILQCENGALAGGSDPRGDGMALGF